MTQPADKPVASVLPMPAAEFLRRAAQTENTPDDPTRRQRAIEDATRVVQMRYPNHFKWEL